MKILTHHFLFFWFCWRLAGIEVSALGLPPEEDWVLGAPYVDRSLMRDALAFDMFREMGRWAPAMEFIELFVMEGDGRQHVTYNDHYKVSFWRNTLIFHTNLTFA